MTLGLFDEVRLGGRIVANRVVFGPHVTNLARRREMSDRHVAYYERRARGGCGTIVTEVASVHESDWPYERAPLASQCEDGWAEIAASCGRHGATVLAALGHTGMQGSTAWTQDVLWAPSLVANVMTREQPLALGDAEISDLVLGFAAAARSAVRAGCAGVELNAGQHSLLRQFCSGLTNLRDDRYGSDRSLLLREVLGAVRDAVDGAVVGLRFCVDELAPWAGITPGMAAGLLADLEVAADYVCLVRGSIYSEAETQPDGHTEQACNEAQTALVADALQAAGRATLVCAQGSIVDIDVATRLISTSSCDLVEMTRAQIADPDLCAKAARGQVARIRPCLLCNQHCLVRDPRNPIVSCCVNPLAGHELDEIALDVDGLEPEPRGSRPDAIVVGAGVAGMEAARLLARLGHRVTVLERDAATGGTVRTAARLPGRERLAALCDWLEREVAEEGAGVQTGVDVDRAVVDAAPVSIAATGGVAAPLELRDGTDDTVEVIDAAAVADGSSSTGEVVVLDPVGGPVGIGIAEMLAARGCAVTLVTPDVVAGSQLSASGDLVAANTRLAALGVQVRTHAGAVAISNGAVIVEDRFTGLSEQVVADLCVDAGHRVPGPATWGDATVTVGDAIAPRGILMAMLEARRAALGPAGGEQ